MIPKLSLSLKVAILALVNVLLLTGLLLIFAYVQFSLSFDSFLLAPAREHILSVANDLRNDLADLPVASRKDVLDRFSKEYGVGFHLVDFDGKSMPGTSEQLPQAIVNEVRRQRPVRPPFPQGAAARPGQSSGRGQSSSLGSPQGLGQEGGRGGGGGGGGFVRMKTEDPTTYWRGIPLQVRNSTTNSVDRGWLLLTSAESLNQFFFDPKPWIAVIIAVIAISVAVWLPLMRGLTRAVSQMTDATGQIAEGQFDIRLKIRRQDEVGQLASSINRMSMQLDGFVKGQKRFLADIAHELCAPVARMQMALGILEQRGDDAQREYIVDVQDEAQHMSTLINELLSFSKAGMQVGETEIVPVPVAATVQRVLERETTKGVSVQSAVTGDLKVLANPDYLFRALSNLVRNAIRYAGTSGPISVSARSEGHDTVIVVADSGPGLPESSLEEVFAPFFRLERSRGRDMGGTGLGLAIVRASVEACKGTVHAHNRKPTGLEVEIRLRTAEPQAI